MAGDANAYVFVPEDAFGPDRELVNGSVDVAVYPPGPYWGTASYTFRLPLYAKNLEIDCMVGSGAVDGVVDLLDPDGVKVWSDRPLGQTCTETDIREWRRGGAWELRIEAQELCHGFLTVQFQAENGTYGHGSEFAFAPEKDYSGEIRALFSPGEIRRPTFPENLEVSYGAPHGAFWYGPADPYPEGGPNGCESRLLMIGRQRFTFVSEPGEVNRTTFHNVSGRPKRIEYQIGTAPRVHHLEIPVGQSLSIDFGGPGQGEVPRLVRIMSGFQMGAYDVTSSAPHAVVGPTNGFM